MRKRWPINFSSREGKPFPQKFVFPTTSWVLRKMLLYLTPNLLESLVETIKKVLDVCHSPIVTKKGRINFFAVTRAFFESLFQSTSWVV